MFENPEGKMPFLDRFSLKTQINILYVIGAILVIGSCIWGNYSWQSYRYERFYSDILRNAEESTGSRRHSRSSTITINMSEIAEIEYELNSEIYNATLVAFTDSHSSNDSYSFKQYNKQIKPIEEGQKIKIYYNRDNPDYILYDGDIIVQRVIHTPNGWKFKFGGSMAAPIVLIIVVLVALVRRIQFQREEL